MGSEGGKVRNDTKDELKKDIRVMKKKLQDGGLLIHYNRSIRRIFYAGYCNINVPNFAYH